MLVKCIRDTRKKPDISLNYLFLGEISNKKIIVGILRSGFKGYQSEGGLGPGNLEKQ